MLGMKKMSFLVSFSIFVLLSIGVTDAATPRAPTEVKDASIFGQQDNAWDGLYCTPASQSASNQAGQTQIVRIAKKLEDLNHQSGITPEHMTLKQKYDQLLSQYDTCIPISESPIPAKLWQN
jgi:hypothetical protein